MLPKNGGATADSRKRKMKDILVPSQKSISTDLCLDLSYSKQQVLEPKDMYMSQPFSSFTSLLNGEDEDPPNQEDLPAKIHQQHADQINQIIAAHSNYIRHTLTNLGRKNYSALLSAVEERASKRLREKEMEMGQVMRRNAEMEERAVRFSTEAHVWRAKARAMEESVISLRAALREATLRQVRSNKKPVCGCGGCESAQEEESAESSFVDPERVEPVSLACKACGKRIATMMMWPCRHICVCSKCDPAVKSCLVCLAPKSTSVEVCLP